MSFVLNWKQDTGRLAEALMGEEYVGSPRNLYTDDVIGETIESGAPLRQIMDLIATEAQSLEELVAMVWALGVFDGATSVRGGRRL